MNKLLFTVTFFAVSIGASALHFHYTSFCDNSPTTQISTSIKTKVITDTSLAVNVTIKNADAWLPMFRLEHYPFLIDAFKYGDMFRESDVQYISHHIREADFPRSLQNNGAALKALNIYLIATFENKWDKLALLWIPKKAANLSGNPSLDVTDDRGLFMVITQNGIQYDKEKWTTQQVSFDDGFEAVTNPSEPAKVANILSNKIPRPSLFGSFFSYAYGWLNNGFKDVNGGSDVEGTDGTIRNYLQVYLPDASGPNYVYKKQDGSYFTELIFTRETDSASTKFIKNIVSRLVPLTDDVFINRDGSDSEEVYYLLHEDANANLVFFGQFFSILGEGGMDTVIAHMELYPAEKYPVDNYLRASLYITKSNLAKNRNLYSKAFYWLQRAASLKDDDAMYRLGFAYYNGEGTAADLVKAKYWLELSAAAGNKTAKEYLIKTGLKKK